MLQDAFSSDDEAVAPTCQAHFGSNGSLLSTSDVARKLIRLHCSEAMFIKRVVTPPAREVLYAKLERPSL